MRIALLALSLALLGNASAPPPDNGAKAEQAQPAPNVERSLEAIATAENRIAQATNTGEYQQPCGDGEYNNRSDLCAQWYAARAARDAADWAFWSVLIAAVGTIGLGITLFFNYRLLHIAHESGEDAEKALKIAAENASAAMRAAKASREANEIARETQLAQLRPYLGVSDMTVKFDHMHGIGFIADTFTVSIEVHNFGQTPARLVKFEAEWAIIDVGAWSDAYGPYSLASLPLGEIPPNFNIEEELGGSGLKPFHEQVLAGTHAFEVRARIDCRDGFGRDYSTFVRRYCTGSQYNVGKLRSSPKGNAMH